MTISLTREQFEAKRQQAAANGFHLLGDSGQVSGEGVTLGFVYSPDTLTITILKKPWVVPESWVENKVQAWFS